LHQSINLQFQQRSQKMKRTLLTAGILALAAGFGTAQAGGDAVAGKAKAASCIGCHGANGEGKAPNPALAGKPEGQLVQAIKDYQSGKRVNPVMKSMVGTLSDQDTANLAAYYASLKGK
jgi:cytochrome c553